MFTFGPSSRGGVDPRISLLLRANSANGSTPIDDSSYANVPTGNISIVQSAAAKYGAAGMEFTGGPQKYLDYSWAASGPFDFGAGDFTIEMWIRLRAATGDVQAVFSQGVSPFAASNFGVELRASESGFCMLMAYVGGSSFSSGANGSLPIGSWAHLAGVRNGGVLRVYVNGVQTTFDSQIGGGSVNAIAGGKSRIGSRINSTSSQIANADIDDYRIIKGLCLYPGGTTFTPPAAF